MHVLNEKYHFKKVQLIAIIAFIFINSLSLISPYIMGRIIDTYIPNKDIGQLTVGILLFVAVPLVSILVQMIMNYLLIKYIRKKGNEIGIDILKKILHQKKEFFDGQNSLEMLSHANKEIVQYVNFYIYELAMYYVQIIMIVALLVSILLINPLVFGIQLLYFPVAILPVKVMTKNITNEVTQIIENNAKINQVKGDIIKNIEYVKINRLEDKKIKELESYNTIINGVWGKVAALETTSGIWSDGFAKVFFTGVTFGISALLVLKDQLSVGQLVSILSYSGILYGYINTVLKTSINDLKNEAEYEKTLSYLSLEDEDEQAKQSFSLNDSIEFKDVTFGYSEDKMVLNHLDVKIKAHQWTTITGKSGIGKSTILDLIEKLYDGYTGDILVDGVNIQDINAYDLRNKVSKITQDTYLFPGSIKDNMYIINDQISDKEIEDALEFVDLKELIKTLPQGLNTDIGEMGKLLSGGEKQRLSIALGLLRKTKVLLLDEVTSNLDAKTETWIMEHFKALKDQGYTIISVSHKESFNQYSDQIIEIK